FTGSVDSDFHVRLDTLLESKGNGPVSWQAAFKENWIKFNKATGVIQGRTPSTPTQAAIRVRATQGTGYKDADIFIKAQAHPTWAKTTLDLGIIPAGRPYEFSLVSHVL